MFVLCFPRFLRDSILFRPLRGIRRQAQDELAFRYPHAAYAGIDLELQQVAHLRHSFGAKSDLFPGSNSTKEFHAPDRGKKEERLWDLAVTGCRRDASRLRERLGQDDAGNQWITGKMTGEDRIIRGKRGRGFREVTRVALDQFPHENKRRPVWQIKVGERGWRMEDRGWRLFQRSILNPPSSILASSPQPLTK